MKTDNINRKKMTGTMKIVTVISSLMILAVLLFPIWKIDFTAPQYPEGLRLWIHANKLSGDVDIINGLNHYIGMKHLDAEKFIEFKALPIIITGFAVLGLLTLIFNRRKVFNSWVILFVVIAVVSMADFYRWEYDYGHDLDPTAAIQVPGMAYQPPLIGFKKLLNFTVYSIPSTGGWIFIATGLLLVGTWLLDFLKNKKLKTSSAHKLALASFLSVFLFSCSTGPQQINYGKDACDFCKMNIVDSKFASQIISTKGKIYRFDDIRCTVSFLEEGNLQNKDLGAVYFSDNSKEGNWIKSDMAFLLQSETLRSPMGGNAIAFASEQERTEAMNQFNGTKLSWQDINPLVKD
jgi:copper chaperone NosL